MSVVAPKCKLVEFISEYVARRSMDIPIENLSTEYLKQSFSKRFGILCNIPVGCVADDEVCDNDEVISPIVPICDCPDFVRATEDYSTATTSYYANIYFDMSAGFSCPFQIHLQTNFTSAVVPINSLTDFTSNIGSIYLSRTLIGGFPEVKFWITKTDGTICVPSQDIIYGCDGPTIQTITLNGYSLGVSPLKLIYGHCGDTCQTMNFSYTQISPVVSMPDIGTFIDIVPCNLPYTVFHYLNPVGVGLTDIIAYSLIYTDCCGIVVNQLISYTQPCTGPQTGTINGVKFIMISTGTPVVSEWILYGPNIFVLGIQCNSFQVDYVQTNVLLSGVADSGSFTVDPAVITSSLLTTLSPNTDFVGYTGIISPVIATTFPIYDVTYTDCCGTTFTQTNVTFG